MRKAMSNTTTESVDVNGTNFVFREIGKKGGVPVVFLHHLTAVLDDWDPRVVDGLAAKHHVIVFDNRGVDGSGGSTPKTVEGMARDAVAFIGALGFSKVDLLGFSLGGFVSQVIAQQQPGLVRKIILAGTGPAGGDGIVNVGAFYRTHLARQAPPTSIRSNFCSLHRRATARQQPTTSYSAWKNAPRILTRP
jgi:pimeloyl-ACP methyl ester carboxylesterase